MSQTAYEAGMIPPETLGWRLQRALSFADVSVEQMAAELGVSRSTVSRWLNDRGNPSLGYMKVWALRCGVPLNWLMHGDDDPRGSSADIRTGISGQVPPPTTAEIKALMKRIPLTRPAAAKADMRS